jgi:anti-sigma regulatory factor (Ser/Thr protein kinase)
MTITPAAPTGAFCHEALFYDGDAAYVAGIVPFLREGVRAGEPVMVAVGVEQIALLRDALGTDAGGVHFADMAELGANPARIIPAWRDFVDACGAPGRPVRGIGEPIWSGRSSAELVECQLHESLLNVAFADEAGFRLLCPYDLASLDPAVLHEACCSHPVLVDRRGRRGSRDYRGLGAVPPPSLTPLPPPPGGATPLSFDADGLADVRDVAAACADDAGLDQERQGDLVLAVHELATNSVLYGGGIGVLRAWADEETAVCEIRDRGHIDDVLAGRHTPRPGQTRGWGLWIANTTCDLVQIRSHGDGTVIRVHMHAG